MLRGILYWLACRGDVLGIQDDRFPVWDILGIYRVREMKFDKGDKIIGNCLFFSLILLEVDSLIKKLKYVGVRGISFC